MAGRKQFDVDAAVEQAMRVFWQNGYAGASLEQLSAATGLGRGSLYGTFGSKDGLFLKALQRYSENYGARFDAALAHAGDDPVGSIAAFFGVVLARSGGSYTVPAGQSVVQVLGEHGVFIPTSCEQGICGTCITGVLEGVPEHRDVCLSDEERSANQLFTPCCSRARSATLVLDL